MLFLSPECPDLPLPEDSTESPILPHGSPISLPGMFHSRPFGHITPLGGRMDSSSIYCTSQTIPYPVWPKEAKRLVALFNVT